MAVSRSLSKENFRLTMREREPTKGFSKEKASSSSSFYFCAEEGFNSTQLSIKIEQGQVVNTMGSVYVLPLEAQKLLLSSLRIWRRHKFCLKEERKEGETSFLDANTYTRIED